MLHHPEIVESAAIGVPDKLKGMALVVFCVLRQGFASNAGAQAKLEKLRAQLKQMLIAEMGKALAPKAILFVSDLPKTRNAKVMRRVIRTAYLGQEPGDISSLVNPEAVEEIKRAN